MSVEKMQMINIIGHLEDMDSVAKQLVLLGCMHVVNAQSEIENNNFTISTNEKNIEALVDVCFVKPYVPSNDLNDLASRIDGLIEAFDISPILKKSYVEDIDCANQIVSSINDIYKQVETCYSNIKYLEREILEINELQNILRYIQDLDVDLQYILNMEHFNFRLGKFTKENMMKLKKNYENVPAILFRVSSYPGYDIALSLYPKTLEVEIDRIFTSLSYVPIELPNDLSDTPLNNINRLEYEKKEKSIQIQEFKNTLSELKDLYVNDVLKGYSLIKIHEKIREINSKTVCSDDFFYMAGWVPKKRVLDVKKSLIDIGDRILLFQKDISEMGSNIIPPTKLNNNRLVRPFEKLVSMYGVPSYKEADPTPFVGLSYMIMFGMMFGDVGQGMIFFLAGMILSKLKKRTVLGGILSRIGFSSMIFGALFGSIFGFEEVIHPLLARPMDNIMLFLTGAIVFGVVLISIAFAYNMLNSYRNRNIEEGLFGSNGMAGLLFYWMILFAILSIYLKDGLVIPMPVFITMIIVILAMIVLKEPLANLVLKKSPLHHESKTDYYIEGSFGIFELILSLFSNTVSFIRIGAFALNHVGLFIAFMTMARMINNNAGSLLIIIIGNIVIIGLEGLIVFIQGLRLEYYELFSKFYTGDGLLYSPVKLDII